MDVEPSAQMLETFSLKKLFNQLDKHFFFLKTLSLHVGLYLIYKKLNMSLISLYRVTKNFLKVNCIFEISILKTDYSAFLNQAFLLATYLYCSLKKFNKSKHVFHCLMKG